jgi:hypothetical protein
MDSKTYGFEGWKEVKFHDGKGTDGQMQGREGFRNVVNGEEFIPEKGWDGEPPYPTGELNCRHVSTLYRQNYDQIQWEKQP